MAFVILHAASIEKWKNHDIFARELKQFARKALPGFAIPEWVKVVSELPVSNPTLIVQLNANGFHTENIHWQDSETCIEKRSS